MKLARSTYYYHSRRATEVKKALHERITMLCAEFPRYGYRRITAQPMAARHQREYQRLATPILPKGNRSQRT
ncbi:MAG: hypothetical protein IVW54_22610 [Candidatus Binataceae bacterium]|nr:hypothetical protein [Candidatus Binataceae bacterium]